MNPLTRRGAHTAADASGTTSQGGTSTGATPPTSTPTVWCPPSVAPLPAGRSPLSSLFCRRCFAYDCVLHPPAQALPRWHYAPICYAQTARPKGEVLSERPTTAPAPALAPKGGIDVSAPLADFVIAANAAVPTNTERSDVAASWRACTCKLYRPPEPLLDARAQAQASFCNGNIPVASDSGGGTELAAAATGSAGKPLTSLHLRRKRKEHREQYGTMCLHTGSCDTWKPGCVCVAKVNFCEVCAFGRLKPKPSAPTSP